MSGQDKRSGKILGALQERAKELDCLYKIEGLLQDLEAAPDDIVRGIVQAIPLGWKRSASCHARITLRRSRFESENFRGASRTHRADICVGKDVVGAVEVFHVERTSQAKASPLPLDKRRLIDVIAMRLGRFLYSQQLVTLSKVHRAPGQQDRTSGNQEVPDATGGKVWQDTGISRLCTACIHSPVCAYLRCGRQPVLSCREFDDGEEGSARSAGVDEARRPETQAQTSEDGGELPESLGLCTTCEHRETCTFPRPEGGIWQCEEFE